MAPLGDSSEGAWRPVHARTHIQVDRANTTAEMPCSLNDSCRATLDWNHQKTVHTKAPAENSVAGGGEPGERRHEGDTVEMP